MEIRDVNSPRGFWFTEPGWLFVRGVVVVLTLYTLLAYNTGCSCEITMHWYLPVLDVLGVSTVFVVLVLLLLQDHFGQRQNWRENQSKDTSALPVMALAAMKMHDGVALPQVYCCVKGRIYDVSSSRNFSPGGSYAFLAGGDATVGLAKMSFEAQKNQSENFDLTPQEWRNVDNWVCYMDAKYPCIALLKEHLEYERRSVRQQDLSFERDA